jgi:hypothetical protein
VSLCGVSSRSVVCSRDRAFLARSLALAARQDPFVRRYGVLPGKLPSFSRVCSLLHLAETAASAPQLPIALQIIRADYMLDYPPTGHAHGIKQVEVNMISAAFAGLSPRIAGLHRHVADRHGDSLPMSAVLTALVGQVCKLPDSRDSVPADGKSCCVPGRCSCSVL